MTAKNEDLYSVLGTDRGASQEAIREAYWTLARRLHPDARGGDGDRFAAVAAAYHVLGQADRRARYDATGATTGAADVRKRMTEVLVKLFGEVLQLTIDHGASPEGTDIMARMRQEVEGNLGLLRERRDSLCVALNSRERVLARIVRDDGRENLFADVLGYDVRELRRVVGELDATLESLVMAADELAHYRSEVELVRAMHVMQFGGMWPSSSGSGTVTLPTA